MSAGYRVGQGFDIHRLVPDRKLILGGIEIPHETGLSGHSDADVLLHALMNALLGAVGKGDIGTHFPDTDPRFKGVSSVTLIGQVLQLTREAGFAVVNADITVIAQRPRLAPHYGAIRTRLAKLMEVPAEVVNLKAGTMEGLGSIGEGKAIAAMAVVLLHAG
ncbi:MAG: 2-C-methyl-D-erythritol 2,4-cyclodiphosphate synthase [Deltaproteobacteria bacterium]|nr:2-C-methyl-D-erythritol 2,4-cyclodiphosphate synthase [Deltaproteobacteria bacterium]